jgi:hypothetical protein
MRYLILIAMLGAISNAVELKTGDLCFIDGSMSPRCVEYVNGIPQAYVGVSWPVYTDDTPEKVWTESNRRWMQQSGDFISVSKPPSVKHVRIDTPDLYPDVVCFDFYHHGVKDSQTCFDTMEITER